MAKPLVKVNRNAHRELVSELNQLRDRLMREGLLMTFHAMDLPLKTAGWEMAALYEGNWPDSIPAQLRELATAAERLS